MTVLRHVGQGSVPIAIKRAACFRVLRGFVPLPSPLVVSPLAAVPSTVAPADRRCGGTSPDARSLARPVSFVGLVGREMENLLRQLGREARDGVPVRCDRATPS